MSGKKIMYSRMIDGEVAFEVVVDESITTAAAKLWLKLKEHKLI